MSSHANIAGLTIAAALLCASTAVHAQTKNRPATSAVTANTCLEKLASGASRTRCEQVATRKKSSQQSDTPGVTRSSFLNPRAPGAGVVTVVSADARQKAVTGSTNLR
jgi:hypothetical protein